LKIIHYILACCSVKDKAQLQTAHNIVTYTEMVLYSQNVLKKLWFALENSSSWVKTCSP